MKHKLSHIHSIVTRGYPKDYIDEIITVEDKVSPETPLKTARYKVSMNCCRGEDALDIAQFEDDAKVFKEFCNELTKFSEENTDDNLTYEGELKIYAVTFPIATIIDRLRRALHQTESAEDPRTYHYLTIGLPNELPAGIYGPKAWATNQDVKEPKDLDEIMHWISNYKIPCID